MTENDNAGKDLSVVTNIFSALEKDLSDLYKEYKSLNNPEDES